MSFFLGTLSHENITLTNFHRGSIDAIQIFYQLTPGFRQNMPQVGRDSPRKNISKTSKAGMSNKVVSGKGEQHGKAKGTKGTGGVKVKGATKGDKQRHEPTVDQDTALRKSVLIEELKTKIDRSQLQENSTDVYRVYEWKKKSEKNKETVANQSSYICIPDKWVREKFNECRTTQSDLVLPSELRSNPERRIEEAFNRFRNKANLGRTVSLDDFSSTSKVGQLTQFWNTLLGNGIEAVEKKCSNGLEKEESENVIKLAEKIILKKGRVKLKMPYYPPSYRRSRIRERVFDRSAIRRAGRYRGRRAFRQQIIYSDVALVPSPDPSTFVARMVSGDSNREFRLTKPVSPPSCNSPIPEREISNFSFDEKITYNDVVATLEKLQALLVSSKNLEEIEVSQDVGRQIVNLKNVLEEEKPKAELLPKVTEPGTPEEPQKNILGTAREVGFSMKVTMNGPYHEYTESMAFHGGWARVLNPPREISVPSPHTPAFEELPVFYASVSFDRGNCMDKLAPYIYPVKEKEKQMFVHSDDERLVIGKGEILRSGELFKSLCFEIFCMPGHVACIPVNLVLRDKRQDDGSMKITLTLFFYVVSFFYLFGY